MSKALEKLKAEVDSLIEEAGHGELFGEDLREVDEVVEEVLLNKFLKANKYDVEKTKNHLVETLKWRKEFGPLSAAFEETHHDEYERTGVITEDEDMVVIWELTGEFPDEKETKRMFGDFGSYIRWYIGMVEKAVNRLDFSNQAKSRLTRVVDDRAAFEMDRSTDNIVAAARKKRMDIVKTHYPEMVEKIYLLNTPRIVGWAHTLLKPWLSKDARERGHVFADGRKLAHVLGDWVPKEYGGKAESLVPVQFLTEKNNRSSSLLEEEKGLRSLRKRK